MTACNYGHGWDEYTDNEFEQRKQWIQNATVMAHLLHLHMPVDADSRRIRARFRSGFVRIRWDSRGLALVLGGDEQTVAR